MAQQYLSPAQAAELLGVDVSTLKKMRARGSGPPFFKVGTRHVRYDADDLHAWIQARKQGAPAAPANA